MKKKLKKILSIILLIITLLSMNLGCVNASMFTEKQHLSRIERRVNRKIDDWEYSGSPYPYMREFNIQFEKGSYEDFAIYSLYDENEQFKYVLIEFEPYGMALIEISSLDIGLTRMCFGQTMYPMKFIDGWYPYHMEFNGFNSYDSIFQYNENGEVIYYQKSPYYVTNNMNSRKYLIDSNSGYIPAVKQGEVYINLISGKTLDIEEKDWDKHQPAFGGHIKVDPYL